MGNILKFGRNKKERRPSERIPVYAASRADIARIQKDNDIRKYSVADELDELWKVISVMGGTSHDIVMFDNGDHKEIWIETGLTVRISESAEEVAQEKEHQARKDSIKVVK